MYMFKKSINVSNYMLTLPLIKFGKNDFCVYKYCYLGTIICLPLKVKTKAY